MVDTDSTNYETAVNNRCVCGVFVCLDGGVAWRGLDFLRCCFTCSYLVKNAFNEFSTLKWWHGKGKSRQLVRCRSRRQRCRFRWGVVGTPDRQVSRPEPDLGAVGGYQVASWTTPTPAPFGGGINSWTTSSP